VSPVNAPPLPLGFPNQVLESTLLQRRRGGATAGSVTAFPELAVVAPTYNERGNLRELVSRLSAGLEGVSWEAIVVDDDSPDGTADLAREIGRIDPRVRLIRRVGRRGLSSACIEGMLSSNADYIAVIDSDLQHDPALLTLMLATLRGQKADIVVASRYVDGGDIGDWSAGRSRLSRWSTRLARKLSGASVADPMSGYFLMRRQVIDERAARLSGRGFKILLDILMAGPEPLRIVELPFTFGQRRHGRSKLNAGVLWDGLRLLVGKALANRLPARLVAFSGVGASGVAVQFATLSLAMAWSDIGLLPAQTIATLVAMTSNFTLNDRVTFANRARSAGQWGWGMARFLAVCGVGLGINLVVCDLLFEANVDWRLAALGGLACAAAWNFAGSCLLVWGPDCKGRT
jgi:dolichol-phosphate mannosyltransferase